MCRVIYMAQRDIYRVGGPTHAQWVKEVNSVNRIISDCDALVTDPEDGWTGVDPTKLPEGVADYYSALTQAGAWHGWLAS